MSVKGAVSLQSVSPILQVPDMLAALEFYRTVLGFEVAWTWGDPMDHAAVCRDKVEIMLALALQEPQPISSVYIVMSGIDDYHAGIVKAGGNVTVPLAERPYGMRDFRVVDPAGNQLSFGEAVATGS